EATEAVAKQVMMFEQFLTREWTQGRLDPKSAFRQGETPLLLQGHCQQKAVLGTTSTRTALGWVSGRVSEADAGCCGMAGSFGYAHHDVSMRIGEQRLFPLVRDHPGEVVACGFSCRHQIEDG